MIYNEPMKGFILGIVTVLVIGAVGWGSYQMGKKGAVSTPVSATSTPLFSEAPATLGTPVPTPNDNELIKAALYKENNWPDNSVTVTVNTNDGTYASGTAGGSGGGGYFYAIKVADNWKIVANSNGTIDCSALTAYPNYPKSLIPECFDSATQSIIKR